MNIYEFINIIRKQLKWLITLPIIMGLIMYFATGKQAKTYSTKATLFTAITSGSSLDNLGNNRVDFFASKTAYNNLITIINSRKVIEETSLRLLTLHLMLDSTNASVISNAALDELNQSIPEAIKKLVVLNNQEATYKNLRAFMAQDKSNYLYGLINFDHPHYSYKAISSLKTRQVDGSDIIELSYQTDDPALAYHTLDILIRVFLDEYSQLKVNQASSVIAYFEQQLRKASAELNNAEDRLLSFNKDNQIINYYEQTKHISSQQEKIEIKLQDIVMEFEAAEAILARLEDETQSRYNINLKNKEIIELRELLIVVNQDIASLEIRTNLSEELSAQKTDLLSNKIELENQLRHKLDSLYFYERRSDGIAIDHLLDNWLQTVINYESAKARLLAMETKRKEFEKLFNQFAPLGASLKRIEREIEVKEQSYLEILHHLGLARLKQQNEELMANMKVLDKPFLPIDAEPTKRKLLVLVMAVFTFLFTLLSIFGIELLDNTIKTPSRFEKLNVYPLAGVLPRQTKQKQDWDLLFGKGLKTLIDRINSKVITSDSDEPLIVQIFSHQEKEGKSYAIDQLSKALLQFNHKLISLSFGDQEGQLPREKLLASDYRAMVDGFENYDLVLVEVPALANQHFFINPMLLQSAQLNYVVVEASRNWSKADDFIRKQFEEQTQIKASAILNHTRAENMEELIGEIPKSRSKLRRFVKRIVVKR